MNLPLVSNNKFTVIAGFLLGIFTSAVHDWNRTSNNVVGLSSTEEQNATLLIFTATIVITYALPLFTSFFSKKSNDTPSWPILEVILVASGVLLGMASLYGHDLITDSVVFCLGVGVPQDVIGVSIGYTFMVVAYWSALKKVVISWGARSWGKLATSGGVVLLTAIIILITSWGLVYFE